MIKILLYYFPKNIKTTGLLRGLEYYSFHLSGLFFNKLIFLDIPLIPTGYDRKTLDAVDKVFKNHNWY